MVLNVVVTGATSGIGRACVDELIEAGHRVFAGARKSYDLEEIERRGQPRLSPLELDVTDPGGVRQAVESVERKLAGAPLHGLVNNAGIAVGGPVECIPIEELERQLAVNVTGVVRATQAFLPALRRGPGRIVNISSLSARVAAPLTGPYSASKHALEALSDAARRELRPWGIRVAIVQPGAVQTRIWDKTFALADELEQRLSAVHRELYGPAIATVKKHMAGQKSRAVPADKVVDAVLHALCAERPRARYVVGIDARLADVFSRLPTSVQDAILTRFVR